MVSYILDWDNNQYFFFFLVWSERPLHSHWCIEKIIQDADYYVSNPCRRSRQTLLLLFNKIPVEDDCEDLNSLQACPANSSVSIPRKYRLRRLWRRTDRPPPINYKPALLHMHAWQCPAESNFAIMSRKQNWEHLWKHVWSILWTTPLNYFQLHLCLDFIVVLLSFISLEKGIRISAGHGSKRSKL